MDRRDGTSRKHTDSLAVCGSFLILGIFNAIFITCRRYIIGGGTVLAGIGDICFTLISLGAPILFLDLLAGKKEKTAPCGDLSFRELVRSCFIVLGAGYLFRICYSHLVSFLAFVQPSDVKGKGFLVLCLYFVSSVVLPSILEEVLFRERIFGVLEGYVRPILFTSLLFAFSHTGIHSIINAFVFGALLQYVYYKKRRLGYCIIIHFINNTIAFFAYISDEGSKTRMITDILPYIFVAVFFVLVICCFAINTGRKKRYE